MAPSLPSDHCAALLRQGDRDRYLADLFAPEEPRRHLFALHAFDLEVAAIRERISEPAPGEIRLQWWAEVIAGTREAGGHPVAEALLRAIGAANLPIAPLEALIEARRFDLYDDPMPTLADFEGYAGETVSALIQLAVLCLAPEEGQAAAEPAGHGGVAIALTGAIRALPLHVRRGQMFLPGDILAAHGVTPDDLFLAKPSASLRAAVADLRAIALEHGRKALRAAGALGSKARPAFLPLVLAMADLKRLGRTGDPLVPPAPLPAWRRQWLLWRAARRWPSGAAGR